jgi:hypothetical protein
MNIHENAVELEFAIVPHMFHGFINEHYNAGFNTARNLQQSAVWKSCNWSSINVLPLNFGRHSVNSSLKGRNHNFSYARLLSYAMYLWENCTPRVTIVVVLRCLYSRVRRLQTVQTILFDDSVFVCVHGTLVCCHRWFSNQPVCGELVPGLLLLLFSILIVVVLRCLYSRVRRLQTVQTILFDDSVFVCVRGTLVCCHWWFSNQPVCGELVPELLLLLFSILMELLMACVLVLRLYLWFRDLWKCPLVIELVIIELVIFVDSLFLNYFLYHVFMIVFSFSS